LQVTIHLRDEEESGICLFHIEILPARSIPCAYVFLRMNNSAMQLLCVIVLYCPEGKAVEVGVKDGLPENTMFPEYYRSIVLCQELLYFSL